MLHLRPRRHLRRAASGLAALAAAVVLAACDEATSPAAAAGNCADPAPLRGQADPRAPGYIVVFQDAVDARAETARLAEAYGFTPRRVYEAALKGFSAELSAGALAAVRCEATVRYVEHDGVASIS